jgi:four helix bundle protein
MSSVRAFRELRVYKAAVVLRRRVFEVSKAWTKTERYALTDQIRRSSRSVSANVAEAWSKRRYPRHPAAAGLTDAHGEAEETGVWLDTARECGYLTDEVHADLMALVHAAAGGLATMIRQSKT